MNGPSKFRSEDVPPHPSTASNSSYQAGGMTNQFNGYPTPPKSGTFSGNASPFPPVAPVPLKPVQQQFRPEFPPGFPLQAQNQNQILGDNRSSAISGRPVTPFSQPNSVPNNFPASSAFTPVMRAPLPPIRNNSLSRQVSPQFSAGSVSNGPSISGPGFPSPSHIANAPNISSPIPNQAAVSNDLQRNANVVPSQNGSANEGPPSYSGFPGVRLPPAPMPPIGGQSPQQYSGPTPNVSQPPQLERDKRSELQSPLANGPRMPFSGGPPMPSAPGVSNTGFGGYGGHRLPPFPGSMGAPPTGMMDDFKRLGLQPQSVEARPVDLLADRHILPQRPPSPVEIRLPSRSVENPDTNCDPSIFRCTLNAVPQTQDLLKKSRLPLGLVLHPFKDMKSLTILQVSVIVRCRACRTYINPFVSFTDSRHWKCNICYRINDLPDDFSWDPVTKSFGEPNRRPEIKYATIEFLAPQEYMLRPPQAAVYLFVLDVSSNAIDTGYLGVFCDRLLEKLDSIPGDKRTMIGFIGVDSGIHFYQFSENSAEPKELIVTDLEDMFLPTYEGLLVNLAENREMIREFVQSLPSVFQENNDVHNALGAAVKVAHQLIADVGGRITVMQTVLPDVGPGALTSREDPNLRSSNDVQNLGPATDYYKLLALECSGHQVAIDLFLLSSQYADLATLAGMSKFCGGSIHYYPGIHLLRNSMEMKRFEKDLNRYLTRKIGFESVLRIRCCKGLSLHTFHGNFFVRSTDLLALPNINPDSAMGVRVQMEENLTDADTACFQAALLYTSSRGDRRIRVHTLCLPVSNNLSEIHTKADVEAILSLLSKLAVERSVTSSLSDAREALVNAVVDSYSAFSHSFPGASGVGLLAPPGKLRFLPLFVLGLLKHTAFNFGASVKLDRRYFAMCQFLTQPLAGIMREIYPDLYPLHIVDVQEEEFRPPRYQLSYEKIDRHGVYLMDTGTYMYLYIGQALSDEFCRQLFNVDTFAKIDEDVEDLAELDTPVSRKLREFVAHLRSTRTFYSPLRIIREDSPARELFIRRLVDDRSESSHSYVEFLQHIKREVVSK